MLLNAKSGDGQEECATVRNPPSLRLQSNATGCFPRSDGDRCAPRRRRQSTALLHRHQRAQPIRSGDCRHRLAVRSIKQEIPIQICCSLGLLNERQAKDLKAAVWIGSITTSTPAKLSSFDLQHPTFQDRLTTIQHARTAGSKSVQGASSGWEKGTRT